jgi:hypothetical protein
LFGAGQILRAGSWLAPFAENRHLDAQLNPPCRVAELRTKM